jgi:hypothetical protein
VFFRRCLGVVVAWSSVVLAATACSSGLPAEPAPSASPIATTVSKTTTRSSSSASPADAAGQQAITAYVEMWEDYAVAAETSNWQDPRLSQHATGIALTNLTRGLYTAKTKGVVSRGRPKLNPRVLSMEPPGTPTKVIVTDCGDSTDWTQVRADTGAPADDTPGGRRQINAVVEKQSDTAWRVSDFGVHEVGSC